MTTLVNALEQRGGRYGLQTMCEGGGMANATIIERLVARRAGARVVIRCLSRPWLLFRLGPLELEQRDDAARLGLVVTQARCECHDLRPLLVALLGGQLACGDVVGVGSDFDMRGAGRPEGCASNRDSGPALEPMMIILPSIVRYANRREPRLTDLAPVEVSSSRVAPSNGPPTTPALARNSSTMFVLKAFMVSASGISVTVFQAPYSGQVVVRRSGSSWLVLACKSG